MMLRIRLSLKFGKSIVINSKFICECSAAVDCRVLEEIQKSLVRAPLVLFSFLEHGVSNVNFSYVCGFFLYTLRHMEHKLTGHRELHL
jgi:hypothetical protein